VFLDAGKLCIEVDFHWHDRRFTFAARPKYRPPVVVLLFICFPLDVLGLIVPVGILPAERHAHGPRAKIVQEVSKADAFR